MNSLPSVRSGLLRHSLGDDLLVYDPAADEVHLLDASTKKVFEMLDRRADEKEIVGSLNAASAGGSDVLALAIDQLTMSGLLERSADNAERPVFDVTTRRQAVQRLAAASAAILIPTIVTVTPNAVGAQTINRPVGAACTTDTQCASGCCATNASGTCLQGVCAAVPNNCNTSACRND